MRLNRRKNRGSESRRKPAAPGSAKSSSTGSRKQPEKARKPLARAALAVAADAFGILREILRWPARIWMAVAETLGSLILVAWRAAVLPAWRIGLRLLRALLALG